jgi:hypothetical protein
MLPLEESFVLVVTEELLAWSLLSEGLLLELLEKSQAGGFAEALDM